MYLCLTKIYFDSAGAVRLVYVCHTTAATVPPSAEESCVSDPNPDSASQDSAVSKTESLESNEEPEPAQSRSQESGESPPVAKQERTGTRSKTLIRNVRSVVRPLSSTSSLLLGCTCAPIFICLLVSAGCH